MVSTIYNPLNQYRVVMEAAPQYWQNPEALKSVYVTGTTAPNPTARPRTSCRCRCRPSAATRPTNTPLSVSHQSQFAAATISFNLPPDVSLSQATDGGAAAHGRASACRPASTAPSRAPRAPSRPRSTASPS